MTSPTPRDWEELKKLAEAATPGPWEHRSETGPYSLRDEIWCDSPCKDEPEWLSPLIDDVANPDDAAFIATFNPATVLELIAEVGRARAEPAKKLANEYVDQLHAEISQLKAERDRMAEALGWIEAGLKAVPNCYDRDIKDFVDLRPEEFREIARSALNTGEKTDD